jgi:hypothetical protein
MKCWKKMTVFRSFTLSHELFCESLQNPCTSNLTCNLRETNRPGSESESGVSVRFRIRSGSESESESGSRVKGQGSRAKGQGKGQGSRVKGQGSRVKGQGSRLGLRKTRQSQTSTRRRRTRVFADQVCVQTISFVCCLSGACFHSLETVVSCA